MGVAQEVVTVVPGRMTLSSWRRIWSGAPVLLDPEARPAVDAAAVTVTALLESGRAVYGLNTGFGKLAQTRIGDADLAVLQERLVLSHATGVGEPMPESVVRLMIALKLASLGRGASGARWQTLKALEALLQANCLPVIPSQGSVGASGDLAPLAHMAAVLMGHGEAWVVDERPTSARKRLPAVEALAKAGLEPVQLGPKEGLALVNGTQASTALALAGLFQAEDAFRAALISGALSLDAARGSVAPFDRRIHELRGQPGQMEVAAALRDLVAGSGILASHVDCEKVQDPYCIRCQPQVMGAALDLMRSAGRTLEIEANAVTDNPLVFSESGEAISGGNFHAEPVAFAADQIALAVCEIGSISERRIALLTDPSTSGLPAFLTPNPGLNSGFMMAHVTAAALVSENKQRAYPASVDSIPTSANQEDHVSMATHGARRLLEMTENLRHVISIEYLCAVQGTDFHAPLRSSDRLEAAKALLRARVPHLEDDRYFAADMKAAADVLASDDFRSLAEALPSVRHAHAPPDEEGA